MADTVRKMAAGALAGLVATGPMTLFLEGVHQAAGPADPIPIAPQVITERALATAGVRDELTAAERRAATLVAHFGFGTCAGSAFPLVAALTPVSPLLSGAAYGLAVWAGSYLGGLPALGIRGPLRRSFRDDHVQLVAAHVVWGAALSWLAKRLQKGSRRPF